MTEQFPATAPTAAGEALADALVAASFTVMAIINRIGAEHDLSLSLLRVLGILWDRRPYMSELAEYLGLEKQTMSGLIARAEKRGLVARARNADDRRATDVFLTSEGVGLSAQLRARIVQELAAVFGPLAPAEQEQLQTLLTQILQSRQR